MVLFSGLVGLLLGLLSCCVCFILFRLLGDSCLDDCLTLFALISGRLYIDAGCALFVAVLRWLLVCFYGCVCCLVDFLFCSWLLRWFVGVFVVLPFCCRCG